MQEDALYQEFIAWLKTAPMGFPDSDDMTALIKARYTPEDAVLLTDVPFDERTLEEVAELKQIDAAVLKPRLDALARKGVVWKISVIDPDLCIGCGVCAYKCPTGSIVLVQRHEITEPPADTGEFAGRFLRDLADPLPRRGD